MFYLLQQRQNETMLKYLWLSSLILAFDLISKATVNQSLHLHERIVIVHDWFNLILIHNSGAAFGFLANESGWQRWFLSSIAIIVSTGIVFWIKSLQVNERWMASGLALILGGALGNLFNRLTLGYVVDVFELYYRFDSNKIMHWPAFNIADVSITLGTLILVIIIFFSKDTKAPS